MKLIIVPWIESLNITLKIRFISYEKFVSYRTKISHSDYFQKNSLYNKMQEKPVKSNISVQIADFALYTLKIRFNPKKITPETDF